VFKVQTLQWHGAGRRKRTADGVHAALRQRGISDQSVLRAMDEVPREHFVDPRYVDTAYADHAMPIACGQTISQPYIVAYMTEQLVVRQQSPRARGRTGSGYQARCCRGSPVMSSRRALSHAGGRYAHPVKTLGYNNVDVVLGDGLAGEPAARPTTGHRHRGGRARAGCAGWRNWPKMAS